MEDNLVPEQTQNAQTEPAEAQIQQPEIDTSKLYSRAYNEGKTKAEKDLVSKFRSFGIEDAQSVDEGLTRLSEILGSTKKQKETNEVEQLRAMLEEATKKAEETELEYKSYVQQNKIESELNRALGELEGQLLINQDHLKNLFYLEYEIEENGGSYFASRGDVPILDEKGANKPLGEVLKDFVKQNKYTSSIPRGTGGSTGVSSSGTKPSRAEFNSLITSKSKDAASKAAEMWNLAKKVGWAE